VKSPEDEIMWLVEWVLSREGSRDDNDGTIVGSNSFIHRLKQQSRN
jgi:hypothetical protein